MLIVFGGHSNGTILDSTEILHSYDNGTFSKEWLYSELLPRPLQNIRGVNINNVVYGIGKPRCHQRNVIHCLII